MDVENCVERCAALPPGHHSVLCPNGTGMWQQRESVLHEAHRLVHGDRGAHYGHPLDDMTCTARMVTAMLQREGILAPGAELLAEHISKIMIAVKLSRETNHPKRDNRVDGAGYFETLDMIIEERTRRESTPAQEG